MSTNASTQFRRTPLDSLITELRAADAAIWASTTGAEADTARDRLCAATSAIVAACESRKWHDLRPDLNGYREAFLAAREARGGKQYESVKAALRDLLTEALREKRRLCLSALDLLACRSNKIPRTRRRAASRPPAPITQRQAEAVQMMGEHKGNHAAAARAMGISASALRKLYEKAMRKVPVHSQKALERRLPLDRRGQPNVPFNRDSSEE